MKFIQTTHQEEKRLSFWEELQFGAEVVAPCRRNESRPGKGASKAGVAVCRRCGASRVETELVGTVVKEATILRWKFAHGWEKKRDDG
ncbi:hypothetical protein RYX36_025093 [Vicia faba]